MASRASANRTPEWRVMLKRSLLRLAALATAAVLCAAALMLLLALLTYNAADRSFNTEAGGAVANALGAPGAWASDVLLWLLGVPVGLALPLMLVTARRMWFDQDMKGWQGQIGKCLLGIFLIGLALSLFQPDPLVGLPAGWGGLAGLVAARGLLSLAAAMDEGVRRWAIGIGILILLGAGVLVWVRSLALEKPLIRFPKPSVPNVSLTPVAQMFRRKAAAAADRADTPSADLPERAGEPRKQVDTSPKPPINISSGAPPAAQKAIAPVSNQDDLFGNSSLPSPELLSAPPPAAEVKIDKPALERNARLLESVLDDFHVKGNITEVRPGPVVTMYELEPAPGIKASRVIALADDIARNMSALSARVATIPGRTVIGIELPNVNREAVVLRQLITSQAFADQNAQLPIILGKNISGEPIVADLAPMPHLLIAGTTGSGKSVGLNCMILSLLYRMTPDELRLIMIDPKMLELSIYDDIPHLLSPVVTEPAKAIRALKWAVEQMEDRYRMMASIGVRNLQNYNEKVRAAKAKGKPLGRRVQTGYDPETGQPIYEEEQLDYQPLPQIVVVVDELADLMMTAGKEVEFLIQRLAQKARAAGIHLILATQRPSVDVITGVIKANLPTRISF
ncbi:MAG: DNA translocase FtsK 4TM domain-containing protein, partial [Sphingobium sp.]